MIFEKDAIKYLKGFVTNRKCQYYFIHVKRNANMYIPAVK